MIYCIYHIRFMISILYIIIQTGYFPGSLPTKYFFPAKIVFSLYPIQRYNKGYNVTEDIVKDEIKF